MIFFALLVSNLHWVTGDLVLDALLYLVYNDLLCVIKFLLWWGGVWLGMLGSAGGWHLPPHFPPLSKRLKIEAR